MAILLCFAVTAAVATLLAHRRIDPMLRSRKGKSRKGRTAFDMLSLTSSSEVAALFIEHGLFDPGRTEKGMTMLHVMVIHWSAKIRDRMIETLQMQVCDPSNLTLEGKTALSLAMEHQNSEAVETLLSSKMRGCQYGKLGDE